MMHEDVGGVVVEVLSEGLRGVMPPRLGPVLVEFFLDGIDRPFLLVAGDLGELDVEAVAHLVSIWAFQVEFLGPLVVAVASSRRAVDVLWVVLAAAGVVLLTEGGGYRLDPEGLPAAAA